MSDTVKATARSETQVEASRRNGAQSQGPVTEEGKARSSRNAVRHGVCSAGPAGLEADREAFAAIMSDLEARLRPATPIESHWLHEIGHVLWRQRRLAVLESAVIEAALLPAADGPKLPSLNTLMRYRARLRRELEDAYAELEGAQRMRRTARARAEELEAQRRRLAQQAGQAPLQQSTPGTNEPTATHVRSVSRPQPAGTSVPGPERFAPPRGGGTNEPRPRAA